jgi:hypothetical protein
MRLSIIPCDQAVYIDGLSYLGIDMTWIPEIEGKKVHAVQWYNGEGEVEFVGNFENLKIKKLGVFEKAVELWNVKKKESDKLEQQRLEEENRFIREQEERKQAELDLFIQFELETRELEMQAREAEMEARAHEERCLAEIREMEELAREQAREFEEAAAAVAAALKAEEEYELARRSIPAAIFDVDETLSDDEISQDSEELETSTEDEDEDLFFDIEELLREI